MLLFIFVWYPPPPPPSFVASFLILLHHYFLSDKTHQFEREILTKADSTSSIQVVCGISYARKEHFVWKEQHRSTYLPTCTYQRHELRRISATSLRKNVIISQFPFLAHFCFLFTLCWAHRQTPSHSSDSPKRKYGSRTTYRYTDHSGERY